MQIRLIWAFWETRMTQTPLRSKKRKGRPLNLCVQLSAWDILDIAYLSVKFSNDYRNSKKKYSPNQLVNLYRHYDNKNHIPERLKIQNGTQMTRLELF